MKERAAADGGLRAPCRAGLSHFGRKVRKGLRKTPLKMRQAAPTDEAAGGRLVNKSDLFSKLQLGPFSLT